MPAIIATAQSTLGAATEASFGLTKTARIKSLRACRRGLDGQLHFPKGPRIEARNAEKTVRGGFANGKRARYTGVGRSCFPANTGGCLCAPGTHGFIPP